MAKFKADGNQIRCTNNWFVMIDSFHIALHRMISEEIASRMTNLAAGAAADYSAYQKRVGEITGFNAVLAMCQQIEETRYGSPKEGEE